MRLLFVHAHPDDETLASGLTMASYARRGHDVHVVTCTLGEEGEVIPPELRYLAADRTDTLGPWRREELRRAMAVLGVRHQVLGEDPATGVLSRYRDSGMAGTASAEHPRAFVRADPDEAAGLVRQTVATLRPDVVVTYDRHGGYEHPDHIQTHRVTCAAVRGLAEPAGVPALYAILTPRSWAEQDRRWLAEHLGSGSATSAPRLALRDPEGHYPPSVVADEVVTHEVVDPAALDLQVAALREHRTQVTVYDGYFALSNSIAARLPGREGFARIDPRTGDPVPGGSGRGDRRHTGLLAGVA